MSLELKVYLTTLFTIGLFIILLIISGVILNSVSDRFEKLLNLFQKIIWVLIILVFVIGVIGIYYAIWIGF